MQTSSGTAKSSTSFGRRGAPARRRPSRAPGVRSAHWSAAGVDRSAAPAFQANYNLAFSWLGLVGFFLSGKTFYEEALSSGGMISAGGPALDVATIWAAIMIGIVVGCFSVWHGLKGSPALILDEAGVTGYNLYGRSFVAWDDIDFITHQEAKHYGRTLEIRSKAKWLGVIPRGVCYSPKLADKTAEEVMAALQLRRPDLW